MEFFTKLLERLGLASPAKAPYEPVSPEADHASPEAGPAHAPSAPPAAGE